MSGLSYPHVSILVKHLGQQAEIGYSVLFCRRWVWMTRNDGNSRDFIRIVLQGVAITLISASVIASVSEIIISRTFRNSGKRFTAHDGTALKELLNVHIQQKSDYQAYAKGEREEIRLEQKRLQRQIDRLEGEVFSGRKKPALEPYAD